MNNLCAESLPRLADEIQQFHNRCKCAAVESLGYAKEVGDRLAEAKELVEHGQWLQWVEENCPFSDRQARNYLTIARHWDLLQSKTETVSDLNFKQALKVLEDSDRTVVCEGVVVKEDRKPSAMKETRFDIEYKTREVPPLRKLNLGDPSAPATTIEPPSERVCFSLALDEIRTVLDACRQNDDEETLREFREAVLDLLDG